MTTTILELSDRTITAEEIIPLMTQYHLLPQFLRGLVLDQAIATVTYSDDEHSEFCQQYQFNDAATRQVWLQQHSMTSDQLESWISRELRIKKFQQAQWGRKVGAYFLQRKSQLDQVVCSLIHTQDLDVAQELYFRILENEQPFAELAQTYSQGPEAQTDGIVGPIALGNLHSDLARLFYGSHPGQLWQPTQIGDWWVIARLETVIPAQLDDSIRQHLLNELLETWLQEQVNQQLSTHLQSLQTMN
jgi:parvulin-like peptidyl-prolyl isomerase